MKPNVILNTWHGTMIVNRLDRHVPSNGGPIGVGHQLLTTGAFDQAEVAFTSELLKAMRVALNRPVVAYDIGANIGCHTLVWARELGRDLAVCAVEAQPRIFHMLCGNIAINNLFNVVPVNAAIGAARDRLSFREPDYSQTGSFGSLELRQSEGSEFIGQDLSGSPTVTVPMIPLSDLQPYPPDFIKIDIEGMECEALCDAPDTVTEHRPIVLCEGIKVDQQRLCDFFSDNDYMYFVLGINYLFVPKEAEWARKFIAPHLLTEQKETE
ncbi:FkbM family methyltransferase [Rhodospirillaceae bacterium KN72]|uniref:FkbM family methyltransferase n=1 Tax=Pacificispira spongiicola TaxID=2729598 RepID=A0A7Y0HCZ7_9PROT|nr:FkbM family methyltransferase [Pacificispira spongiicola]NMM43251.1 FkbM family methyltransferase [Pacificispira spongiicola]